MKKLLFLSLATFAAMTALVSCGGSNSNEKKEKEIAEPRSVALSAEDVTLQGNGAQYIKICSDSITFYGNQDKDDYSPKIYFEIEFAQDKPAPDFYDFETTSAFNVVVYDATGKKLREFSSPYDDVRQLQEYMQKGNETPVKFRYSSSISNLDDYYEFFEKAATVEVVKIGYRTNAEYHSSGSSSTSDDDAAGVSAGDDDSDDSDNSSSVASSSKSSSNEWDSILDDYESYVDKMVSLLKKAKNGDATAIVEYTSALEDAQSLTNKLANAKSDMTAAQQSRYIKILNKYNKALM